MAVQSIKQIARGYAHEAYQRIALRARLRNVEHRNPILIYQMGKVGSSTVVHTLRQLSLDAPVLHIHTLSPGHLDHAVSRQRNSIRPYLHEHLVVSALLVKKLEPGVFPCRIITITREPIGRAISFVFEDLKKQAPEAILPGREVDTDTINAALDRLLAGENGVADPTRWFDGELKACLGVDVFARPYDLEQGYTILNADPVSVLVIRMEDLNRSLVPALSAFLDLDPSRITVKRANVGAQKWYAGALDTVKQTYRVSEGPARAVFDTTYFRHFYAADADRHVARWT